MKLSHKSKIPLISITSNNIARDLFKKKKKKLEITKAMCVSYDSAAICNEIGLKIRKYFFQNHDVF